MACLTSVSAILLLLCSLLGIAIAQEDPIVELDYGTFQGRYDAAYNISYFRKIPFGASTAGENRFRAPQPPAPLADDTVYDTDQPFDMCPQRTVNGSEDCLYLALYSRPWSARAPLRPVLVVFYGGGFVQGSASFSVPPPMYPVLNASGDQNDFVVVYPNYRTNAFGFLPGRAVRDSPTADLNAGLLDQRAALRWVQAHIAAFGGDPAAVTIQGQSAGGGSVVAQVLAAAASSSSSSSSAAGSPERLFSRALASSPFWPKTYAYDAPEAEALYAQLAARVGCAETDAFSSSSLACLKAADAQAIRTASLAISALNANTTSSFNWAPVVEGDGDENSFLRSPLSAVRSRLGDDGVTVWSSFNAREGENFVPADLADAGDFDAWLRGYLPRFSDAQLDEVRALYPAPSSLSNVTAVARAGLVYRDSVLSCPGLWLAEMAGAGGESGGRGYLSEYTIAPAKHGSDTQFWNQVNAVQQSQPVTYEGLAGAMASFFQTGDPNTHKLTDDSQAAVPVLSSGKEWLIKAGSFEEAGIDELKTRCAFWRQNAGDVPL